MTGWIYLDKKDKVCILVQEFHLLVWAQTCVTNTNYNVILFPHLHYTHLVLTIISIVKYLYMADDGEKPYL